MLEAAHLRDIKHKGTNDPRNGFPLNAGLHRAFDRHLFAIDPDTFEIVTAPGGPLPAQMGITQTKLALDPMPHTEALRWRFESFQARWS